MFTKGVRYVLASDAARGQSPVKPLPLNHANDLLTTDKSSERLLGLSAAWLF